MIISCEKDVNIIFNNHEPIICLNSIIEADCDSIVIYLTYSKPIFDNDSQKFEVISNAEVKLWENEKLIAVIPHSNNGKYILRYRPVQGNRYKVTARDANDNEVKAETMVPYFPSANIEFEHFKVMDSNSEKGFSMIPVSNVTVYNKHNAKLWFFTAMIHYKGNQPIGSFFSSYKTNYLGFDNFNRFYLQDFNPPFTNYEYIGGLRLNLEKTENEEIITFKVHSGYKYSVFLVNTDAHFDNYYKTSIRHFLVHEYNQLPVIESVSVYSNIENGIGIFGSIAFLKKTFDEKSL